MRSGYWWLWKGELNPFQQEPPTECLFLFPADVLLQRIPSTKQPLTVDSYREDRNNHSTTKDASGQPGYYVIHYLCALSPTALHWTDNLRGGRLQARCVGSEPCHRVAQPSLARPPRRRGFSSEGWAESLARARAFATFLHFLFHRPPKGGKNVDRDEEVEETVNMEPT